MNKLVFKVRGESIYGSFKFPHKLRPQEDELLSSWLIRLCLLHRTIPMTFTNLYLPDTRNRFWSADIDLQGNPELLGALSIKSGMPVEMLHSMTIKSYEGFLVEKVYGKNRATKFVSPLALRGRRSTLPGLRYCPICLKEDDQPYYRKKWRLAYSVVCLKHRCYLADRCQKCGTTLTPYLACKSGRVDVCYKCGRALSAAITSVPENGEVVSVVAGLNKILDDGYVMIAGIPVYSHLYFTMLHQILRLMVSKRYGDKIRNGVGLSHLDSTGYSTFESIPLLIQADLVMKAVWLLERWPQRFVDVCRLQGLLSSVLLKDLEEAPFWFWNVILERLYRPDRGLTANEIEEAIVSFPVK